MPLSLAPSEPRARLRLRSLGWALLAGMVAGGLALVGAVCGIRSLAAPLTFPNLDHDLPAVMMGLVDVLQGWLPLWLPLIGSALLLRGARSLLPALRP